MINIVTPNFISRSKYLLLFLLVAVCIIDVGRLGRIIKPVPQIAVAISKDGLTVKAVSESGIALPVSIEKTENGAVILTLPGKYLKLSKPLMLQRGTDGILRFNKSEAQNISVESNSILTPTGFDGYIVARRPGAFHFSLWSVLLIMGLLAVLTVSLKRGGVSKWAENLLTLARDTFGRYDLLFVIAIAILAAIWPVGVDINVIARTVSYSNQGIDIYAAQVMKLQADAFPWPAYPYPPVTLALLAPIQALNDALLSPFIKLIIGREVASAGISLFCTMSFFAVTLAILAEMHWLGWLSIKQVRSTFYFSILCPGMLYLVAGFQQIDIFGVVMIGFGLLLMRPSRDRLLGAILIAVGLGIKPQNLIIAPVIILFFAHRINGAENMRERLTEFSSLVLTALVYSGMWIAAEVPSYKVLIASFSIIERLIASIWIINPDNRVFSMPLFVTAAYAMIYVTWRPSNNSPDNTALAAMISIAVVVGLYQASMVHNPGLSMFLVLGMAPLLALVQGWIDRLGIMLVSLMAVISWPLSFPGDITRLFTDKGFNKVFGSLPEEFHSLYYSLLFTGEFIGLVLISIIFIGSLKMLLASSISQSLFSTRIQSSNKL